MDIIVFRNHMVVDTTADVSVENVVKMFVDKSSENIWREDYGFDELEFSTGKYYLSCSMQMGRHAAVVLAGTITPEITSKVKDGLKKLFSQPRPARFY
jgi:hypothetical protein